MRELLPPAKMTQVFIFVLLNFKNYKSITKFSNSSCFKFIITLQSFALKFAKKEHFVADKINFFTTLIIKLRII